MKIINKPSEMQTIAECLRSKGKTIGLVPTMGYFHEGHISLMRRCRQENDVVIVSLFVNPTQFGANEDLECYPRDFERDQKMAEQAGVDIIFNPSVDEMYPPGYHTFVEVDELGKKLCGRTRPIHFRGVTTVCLKLFNLCQPHRAYFGLKDAQQLLIVEKMVKDLNLKLEIVRVPTMREEDGLAMSSRNTYLKPKEREAAALLWKSLSNAKEMLNTGVRKSDKIKTEIEKVLTSSPLAKIDYIAAVNTETFDEIPEIADGDLVAIAVHIGSTRLIDNFIVGRG
ncbi:MAG: pantoate--beta-alanine ligase [bacterium]